MELRKLRDKVLCQQELALWGGLLPLDVPAAAEPLVIRWKGAPVQGELLRQMIAFFRYANIVWRSEVQVRLAYRPEQGVWAAAALPQYIAEGLSSKEIAHPDTEALSLLKDLAHAELEMDGFPNGTAHSHCDIGAFDSGGDRADEIGQPGFHVTFGKLSSGEVEIHGRATFRGVRYEIDWSDWLAEPYLATPEELKRGLVRLAVPPESDLETLAGQFPAAWLEACVRRPPAPVRPVQESDIWSHMPSKTDWREEYDETAVPAPTEKFWVTTSLEDMQHNVRSPTLLRLAQRQLALEGADASELDQCEYLDDITDRATSAVGALCELLDLVPMGEEDVLRVLQEAGVLPSRSAPLDDDLLEWQIDE